MAQTPKQQTKTSKFISLILRHKPEIIDITLDEHGWADTCKLIAGINATGRYSITMPMLEEIVRTDNKQRYSFNENKSKIRANQGHSIPVDLELAPKTPPEVLYHGTGLKSVASISRQGLRPMSRQYVHLSKDIDTAVKVGQRHGTCFVYKIDTAQMVRDGYVFYESVNHVWLAKRVPTQYLHAIDDRI